MRTTTGTTIFPPGTRKIAAAITDHGGSVGSKPRPDKFAILSFRHPFSGLRIDALHQEGIGPGMHTISSLTFAGHTWSKEFGHAKFIVCGDVEKFLELQACFPGPGFSTEEADLELCFPKIYAALTRLAANIEANGWCHTHGCDAKIDDEIDHTIILACIRPHGNGHSIHGHGAVMETKTAGGQAIAVAVHQNIARAHAGHPQFACIEIGPVINVPFGRKNRHAFPRCAACCMNFNCTTWTTWLYKCHPIRISSTHRFLFKERKLLDIF